MIGKTISHYKILAKLGEGGMGVVYKAEDTKLKRIVALKFLPSSIMASEAEKTRFVHEAQAAAALNHPNICTIYEIDETDGQQFIAMEFVEGQSLREKIEDGPLKIDEALNIAMQVAEGLQAAHEKGIVHRDIKPANVMITNRGQAKIMDFGLAKLAEQKTRLTKTGMTVGTVAYMSPEQAQGVDADHRADIWAFGVVLYEMISGRLPFRGEYEQAMMYSILNEEPQPLTALRTGVSMELERMVNKAMSKNLDERYQHVDEMLATLRSLSKKLEAGQPPAAETMQASIAVLPFVDMSPQKDQEYFCDGMAEELINALTKLEGLRVVSRTSAFQFKGKAFDIRKIGEQLNVASVLEGSVRKTGDRLRITAQLINVVDGFHLWSEKYDREMKDVFDIQDEISRAVVDALKIKLVGEAATRLVKRYTENLEAYTLYLKGRYYWNKRTEPGLTKGMEYFEKAITKDPGYALAYAGLADCYNVISHYGAVPPKASVPKAKTAAIKALEIDDALVEAHTSLAFALYNYDFAWLAAEKEFQRAIALNPNYATAHHWYAIYLATRGRLEEAIAEMQRARELDPLSLIINTEVGWMLYFGRYYNQAIEQYQKTLEMDPSFAVAHWGLGLAYQQKAMPQEAIAEFQKAISFSDSASYTLASLGNALAGSGKKEEAHKILDELQTQSQQKYVSPLDMALVHAGLGDTDQAIAWLEKACQERAINLPLYLKVEPRFNRLRAEPRFSGVLKKVGLEK